MMSQGIEREQKVLNGFRCQSPVEWKKLFFSFSEPLKLGEVEGIVDNATQ